MRFQNSARLAERLRFHRDHQRLDGACVLWIESDSFGRKRIDLGRWHRLDHRDSFGVEPASQPVSMAPPILPAPASAMVPVMFFNVLLLLNIATTNTAVVPAKAGTQPQPVLGY